MIHQFLPAIGPYVINASHEWRHPIHWLDPDSDFFYGPALISYTLWRKSRWPWRRGQHILFGDSGGYSVVTQGEKVDPEKVIRWQMRMCTKGVMLDIPPYRPSASIQFTGAASQHWEESLAKSIRNVERALPYYMDQVGDFPEDDFAWWGVVQGESWNQLVEWHSRISEVYAFDQAGGGEGWALAPKPSIDVISVVRHLRFARHAGIRNVHLLQVTKFEILAVCFALAKMSGDFDLISYDSASAVRCAVNRNAIVKNDGLGFTFIRQKGDGEGVVHDELMRAENPYGAFYRDAYPLTTPEWPHYVLLHNHRVMQTSFDELWQAVEDDPERILRLFGGSKLGEILREWDGDGTAHKSQSRVKGIFERIK